MKNLIRTNTAGELERNPNPLMHCGEFDPRQVHDHSHGHGAQSSCFVPKSEHSSALEQQQQRLFPCGSGPHMFPMATRSFACSQLTGLVDYSSETLKQQQHHQCKSEKHEEDGAHLSGGKCQMHSSGSSSDGGGGGGGGILVKTEFNEMQQSKSSPVHEVFEMTSSTGGQQFHHDSASPPLSLMEAANSSSSSSAHLQHQHHHHQHHHHLHHQQQQQQQQQHQCSAHSYESYVYAGGSGGRVGMSSSRQPASSSELSGALYHCKSFFADSGSGSGTGSGIAAFYPNTQQSNGGESCRDDSAGFPSRDSLDNEEKVVIAIKARKIPD